MYTLYPSLPLPSGDPTLYARVLYPPGSTRECDETHPVLFYVYGGPYSQMVIVINQRPNTMGYALILFCQMTLIILCMYSLSLSFSLLPLDWSVSRDFTFICRLSCV